MIQVNETQGKPTENKDNTARIQQKRSSTSHFNQIAQQKAAQHARDTEADCEYITDVIAANKRRYNFYIYGWMKLC